MHSLLESYLSEVAVYLSALPVKQRNEELHEMRAHLENAVIVSRELGQPEEEAAQNIVTQFGLPNELGENVVWAWRRERKHTVKSFLGAAFTTLGLACTVSPLVWFLMIHYLIYWFDYSHMVWWATRNLITWTLVGVGTGLLFPKRAVAGTAFVLSGLCLLCEVGFFESHVHDTVFPEGSFRWIEYFLVSLLQCTVGFTAIAAAWISSRWRLVWNKRRRHVRV